MRKLIYWSNYNLLT